MEFFINIYLALILALSAVIDLRVQRIPNWITLTTILIALAGHTVGAGFAGLLFSIKGLLLGTGLLIVPYLMGGMGAGDAKLMGAVGAVVGAKGVFFAFLFTALIGGLYALLIVFTKRDKFQGFFQRLYAQVLNFILFRKYIPERLEKPKEGQPRLCYGLAIALGSGFYIALNITGYELPL